MSDVPPSPPNILVVDDTPANLQLLASMLKDRGYKVRPVPNGELALRAALSSPPDLILLDITLPDLDGFEVCARLKAHTALRDIPVLFISALNETADKIRAFQVGGVDYVTNPFQLEEIEARVHTHLELRRKTRELERNYAQLRQLEQLRDNLTHMIVHDLRSPLLSLNLAIDMICPLFATNEAPDPEVARMARRSVTLLIDLVTQMLDVSRLEAGQLELKRTSADLTALTREEIAASRLFAGERRLTLATPESVVGFFDAALIRRVLGNLLGNALKFTPVHGEVILTLQSTPEFVRAEIADNGPGIAPEHHESIFEKFGQVGNDQARTGSGLGLTFVKMVIEAHGGQVGVRSALGQGSVFWFTLPSAGKAPNE